MRENQHLTAPHQSPALLRNTVVPTIVAALGDRAAWRYVEFFAANIRNPHTRRAYARAASGFFAWCETLALLLPGIQPVHVAAWIEQLGRDGLTAPPVKQNLAAVRMLFDWLAVGQVVPHNPAAVVRGPKYSQSTGKTLMPEREEAKALLAAIDTTTLIGLRDRALIGMLLYTVARISAVTAMRVGDYYPVGKRWWVRLHENGGKEHAMQVHYNLQDWLDAYIEAAGIDQDKKGILFRTANRRSGRLTEKPLAQADAYRLVGRRAAASNMATRIGNHSWQARGITPAVRTTKLYDRRDAGISLDEVERINLGYASWICLVRNICLA